MLLSKLLFGTDVVFGKTLGDMEISGISYDSRKTQKGDAFVALEGGKKSGSSFAIAAWQSGAKIYIGERDVPGLHIPKLLTKNARRTLSIMYANFYGNPEKKLKIIGITGTNGKTTTAFMLKNILSHGGYKCGLIGTVKCMILEEEYLPPLDSDARERLSTMTTPDPDILFMLMQKMVLSGVEVLVMEASSHSLALEKLAPIDFDIAIFTNLSKEHLDFHKTFDEYRMAKRRLFEKAKLAIINADDINGSCIADGLPCKKVYFGLKAKKGYYADNVISKGVCGSEYILKSENSRFKIKTTIPGHFNLYNTMAAAVAAREIGVNLVTVQNAIYSMNGICGRLERIKTGYSRLDISVFLDYAHTPYALENLLECVNGFRKEGQRIVTLFGCGGDRDKEKRGIMGKIATKMSDFVIITSDNSRNESKSAIIKDILSLSCDKDNYIVIKERKEAIEYAIKNARSGDIILLVGKGHEQYEIDEKGVHPFSEKEIVENALKGRLS